MNLPKGLTLVHLLLLVLMILAFSNVFHDHASQFLTTTIEKISASLALVSEFKHIALASSSSHVPLISGDAKGLAATMDQTMQYLSMADGLVTLQLIIIKLSQSILVKLVMVILFAGFFYQRYKSFCLKLLVLLLLINPGLGAYTSTIKLVSEYAKLNGDTQLHQHLLTTREKYKAKEAERQQRISERNQKQLDKAEAKGKDKVGLVKRVEDKVVDAVTGAADKVEEGIAELLDLLKAAGVELIKLSINLLTTVLMQFLLLPLAFFYAFTGLVKRFADSQDESQFVEKLLVLEVLLLLIVGISLLGFPAKTKSTTVNPVAATISAAKNDQQITGVDVSHFQGQVNWQQIKKDGLDYAYAKATQGDAFRDDFMVKNRTEATTAGIPIGFYHFYVSSDDPIAQANNFVVYIKKMKHGELPPVIDLEQGGIKGSIDKAKFAKEILSWLKHVENELKVKPIIYTNHPFANDYLQDKTFADYQLWIAEYDKIAEPNIPQPWKNQGWLMWQRSPKGSYKGIEGQNVDHDLFNGNEQDLKRLLAI